MKQILSMLLICICSIAHAQLRVGIKAGANFADLDAVSFKTEMRTGFHFGAILEVKLPGSFALQPELMYSSQGAKVDQAAIEEIQYDYITVPVLLKYYLLKDVLNVEIGPQFSFLVNDKVESNFLGTNFDASDSSTFDFAAIGGVGVDLGDHIFLQGRYVFGLTEASANADIKNKVIQISVGYKF